MYTILGLDEFLDKYFPSIRGKVTEAKYRLLGKFDCSHKRYIKDEVSDRGLGFTYKCDLDSLICTFNIFSRGLTVHRIKSLSDNGYLDVYPYKSNDICHLVFRASDSSFSMYDFSDDIKEGVSIRLESILTNSVEIGSCDGIKCYLSKRLEYYKDHNDCYYTAWLTFVNGDVVLNMCKLYFYISSSEVKLYDPYEFRVLLDRDSSNYVFNLVLFFNDILGYQDFIFSKNMDSSLLMNLCIF